MRSLTARLPEQRLKFAAGRDLDDRKLRQMATADLTVIALGRPDASASEYIAAIQRRLAEQDRVRYVMHAMGTSLEGETADILAVVGELHAVPFELGSRASTPCSSSTSGATRSRRWDKVASVSGCCVAVPRRDAAPSHLRHDRLNGPRADAPGARAHVVSLLRMMWRTSVASCYPCAGACAVPRPLAGRIRN